MKKSINLFAVALFTIFCAGAVRAQVLPFPYVLSPAAPTSVDNIKLSIKSTTCGDVLAYTKNPYTVAMSQNQITVTMGPRLAFRPVLCPESEPREEFDLGRLPAGNYTLTLIWPPSPDRIANSELLISNAPFTVTDARATKVAPYVRLDYSGHWWDPNDSGWGLFIWHDARDAVLAAWFTYTPDGKPMWYTFQPVFNTSSATRVVDLLQTSRAPGPTSPPPGPNTYTVVGSASLDFAHYDYLNNGDIDTGILSYTFTGGAKLVRNIRRFKP